MKYHHRIPRISLKGSKAPEKANITHLIIYRATLLDQPVYTKVPHRVLFESEIELPEMPSEIISS